MNVAGTIRERVEAILDAALTDGLPKPWPLDAPLSDAGLDSVVVLQVVAEIEAQLAIRLDDRDLSAENFATLASLSALVERRSAVR